MQHVQPVSKLSTIPTKAAEEDGSRPLSPKEAKAVEA